MHTPEIVSISVVEVDNKKKFCLPDSSLDLRILAGKYGSWMEYLRDGSPTHCGKEIDTPFFVFRNGEYYDHGICQYIFGSDGYHVVTGIDRIDKGSDHRSFFEARWFETGDILSFVKISSTYELQRR